MRTPRRPLAPARRASLALAAAVAGTLALALPASASPLPDVGITSGTYAPTVCPPSVPPPVIPSTPAPALAASGGVPGTAWLALAALGLGGLLLAAGHRLRRTHPSAP